MYQRSTTQNKKKRERTHLAPKGLLVRSGLEKAFAEVLNRESIPFSYEGTTLEYIVPESTHRYVVDFDINGLIVETKGRLTGEDRKKMLLVQKQHPLKHIVFIFSNSNKKLYKNSKTSYREWAEKHGFSSMSLKEFEQDPKKIFELKKITKPNKDEKTRKPRRKKLQDLCNT